MLAKSVAGKFLSGPNSTPEIVNFVPYFVSPRVSNNTASPDEIEPPNLMLAKVASDLLYCILQQDESVYHYCRSELEIQGPKLFTNYKSLWRVLRAAINNCHAHSVCILIDGIDRFGIKLCGQLVESIRELISIQKVKIFLCSRDAPHISNALPNDPHRRITINLDTNTSFIKGDVETFIRKSVESFGWDNDLGDRATEALLAKSEGFFLWASLAIKKLKNHCLGPNYDRFLEQPLPGLEAEYGKMLLVSPSQSDAGTILNMIWSVALAVRPLTFAELSHILPCIEEMAAKRSTAHLGAGSVIQPMSEKDLRIYVRCSLGFLRATETTVFMVHRTAREYLLDKWKQGSPHVLSKSEADLVVSWECFQYLHHVFGDPGRFPRRNVTTRNTVSRDSGLERDRQHEGLGEPARELARNDPEQAVSNRAFLRYAAESWLIHAHRSIETSEDMLYDDSVRNWLQYQFFDTSDIIRNPWIKLCRDPRMEILAKEQTPLHIAACLGLMPIVKRALSDLAERTQSNRSLRGLLTGLMHRARSTQDSRDELSFPTAPDQDGNTSLHKAVVSRHWAILVGFTKSPHRACSTGINEQNSLGNTPLHLAFQFNHPDIVQLLVDNGADPAVGNNFHLTVSKLGGSLGRRECLDILEQAGGVRKDLSPASMGLQVSIFFAIALIIYLTH